MTKRRPAYALLGTLAYMLVVAVALVVPANAPHAQRGYLTDVPLGRRLVADVAVNVAIFVPIGWGLHRSRRRPGAQPRTHMVLSVIVVAAAFSLLMEAVQFWLPYRYSSLADVIANTIGAALGASLDARYGSPT